MAASYDITVDFMDMTDDRRVWGSARRVRHDVDLVVGRHVVVGDDDAEPKVARIVSVDSDGNQEWEVPPGTVESHLDLLAQA